MPPLAIDLCCGLGGWSHGLMSEGWRVRGYDIEAHEYGDDRYPGELIIQDILTLDGAELADADLIVASPPCTEYSYMAMPWTRAKHIGRALRGEDEFPEGYKGSRTVEELNALFAACFRIRREASAAAGRHIPMVVENVRGAEPWVGRAAWNFGSYYLWGDVPALMPRPSEAIKNGDLGGGSWFAIGGPDQKVTNANPDGRKVPGFRFGGVAGSPGGSFQSASVDRHVALKPPARVSALPPADGRKGAGAGAAWFDQNISSLPSSSPRRKAASAEIAKIPFALSSHIARVYRAAPSEFLGRHQVAWLQDHPRATRRHQMARKPRATKAKPAEPGLGHNGRSEDQEQAALYGHFMRTVREAQRKADVVKAQYDAAREVVNGAFAEVKTHLSLKRNEFQDLLDKAKMTDEEFLAHQRKQARIYSLGGLTVQLDLFGAAPIDTATEQASAQQSGFRAGKNGEPAEPPASVHPAFHQEWLQYWHNGQGALQEETALAMDVINRRKDRKSNGTMKAVPDPEPAAADDEEGDLALDAQPAAEKDDWSQPAKAEEIA